MNVLFVKENEFSRRGNVSTGTWFELTTVPFPLPIKDVYVDKKLDSWRSGRYQRGAKLFDNKLNNLNSSFYPLLVTYVSFILLTYLLSH